MRQKLSLLEQLKIFKGRQPIVPHIGHKTAFRIEKRRASDPTIIDVDEWVGNVGLNEGINLLTSLLCGGSGTPYDSSYAYLGVGDSSITEAAGQTGLQASSNKAWAGMESGYPIYGSDQQIVFRSVFGSGEANFPWEEFTVGNSNDDSGENLLRATSSRGTKVDGDSWTLNVTVTFS
jgi:hypothetical protein